MAENTALIDLVERMRILEKRLYAAQNQLSEKNELVKSLSSELTEKYPVFPTSTEFQLIVALGRLKDVEESMLCDAGDLLKLSFDFIKEYQRSITDRLDIDDAVTRLETLLKEYPNQSR